MQYLVDPIPLNSSSSPTLAQNRIYAVVAAQGGLVLQVAASGAAATLQSWTEASTQRWRIEPTGNDLFRVRSSDNLVLTVQNASTASGARIIGVPDTGAAHQRWRLEASDTYWIRLRSAHSGLLLNAGAGTAGTAITQSADDGAAGPVTVYRDSNYAGPSQPFGIGRWDHPLPGKVGNDSISSLKVPQGLKVTLFEHARFRGNSFALTGDASALVALADATSSLIVQAESQAAAGAATIYADGNYAGSSQQLRVGAYNSSKLTFGAKRISSLKVPAGLRVTLYAADNFGGASRTYTSDTAWVGDFNDMAMSAVVESTASMVTLYADGDYTGASQTVGVGAYNSGKLSVGVKAISSLKVPAGKRVILYAEDGFSGMSRIYTADTRWVAEFNDLATSVIVEDVVNGVSQHWGLTLLRPLAESPIGDRKVRLFAEPSFQGASQELGIGAWKKSDLTIGDNALSSFSHEGGGFISVKLFENDNFGTLIGDWESGSTPVLGTNDNRASSLKIDLVARFDATDLTNWNDLKTFDWGLPPGRYTRAQFYKNRYDLKVNKVSVPPELRVILYDEDNFTGNERVLVEDTMLDPAFVDKVKSAVVLRRGVAVSPNTLKYGDRLQLVTAAKRLASVALADGTRVNTFVVGCAGPSKLTSMVSYGDHVSLQAGTGAVTLYRDPNYAGPSQKLGVGRWVQADLTLGGDTVSSVRVPAGMKVTLYEHGSFNGIARELLADAPTLPPEIDNRTTSLIVEQISEGAVYLTVSAGTITASGPVTAAPSPSQTFRVILSGPSSQGSITTHGDTITLECLATARLVTANSAGQLTATATVIADNERMVVRDLRALANAAEGGDGTGPCGAEACGQQVCGAAASGAGACGADACGADVCGVDACGVALCSADGSLVTLCAVAAAGLAYCGADVCGAAVCGVDACGAAASGVTACGAAACGAAACGAAACGVAASPVDACSVAANLVDVCPVDACAAQSCAVNACPINACALDWCALDVVPFVPGI